MKVGRTDISVQSTYNPLSMFQTLFQASFENFLSITAKGSPTPSFVASPHVRVVIRDHPCVDTFQ